MHCTLRLALAALAVVAPISSVAAFDISTFTSCVQNCIISHTKHFNLEDAGTRQICKWGHVRTRYYTTWYLDEFRPCVKDLCAEEDIHTYNYWRKDVCDAAGEGW